MTKSSNNQTLAVIPPIALVFLSYLFPIVPPGIPFLLATCDLWLGITGSLSPARRHRAFGEDIQPLPQALPVSAQDSAAAADQKFLVLWSQQEVVFVVVVPPLSVLGGRWGGPRAVGALSQVCLALGGQVMITEHNGAGLVLHNPQIRRAVLRQVPMWWQLVGTVSDSGRNYFLGFSLTWSRSTECQILIVFATLLWKTHNPLNHNFILKSRITRPAGIQQPTRPSVTGQGIQSGT